MAGGATSPRGFIHTPDLGSSDDDDEEEEEEEEEALHVQVGGMDFRSQALRPSDKKSATRLESSKGDNNDDAQRRAGAGYGEGSSASISPSRNRSRSASPMGGSGQSSPFLRHTSTARPTFSRRSTMRSVSPGELARDMARKKYAYAAFFLAVILVSFVVQTELSVYIQRDLGWNKAYCMLYLTHGSWVILWPMQLLILRLQKRDLPWPVFWQRHLALLRSTAAMVQSQKLDVGRSRTLERVNPVPYIIKTTAFITSALTVAGLSWYIAVDLTSPSDLTAIYNCSAFFAYVFSVPLLGERLRKDKSIAVAIAIAGVLVVAYGDGKPAKKGEADSGTDRQFLGNMVIGVGSVLYGLYEVLYKRYACPPDGVSPGRGTIFANTFGSCIGVFTLLVLWIPLPILHITGWEPFVLPTGYTAWLLLLSVFANATFAGSFLVLISLTSPVLSSVASLLTIFVVAITDWMITGEPLSWAAVIGGVMITVAFGMLSWSTWKEMSEETDRELEFLGSDSDDAED